MEEMKLREFLGDAYDSLTEEQKAQALACKSADELLKLAGASGVELPDEALDSVSGGCTDRDPRDVPAQLGEKVCAMCGQWKAQTGGMCFTCYGKFVS